MSGRGTGSGGEPDANQRAHPRESRAPMPLHPHELLGFAAAVILAGIVGAVVNVLRDRG